jgi:hypothetical protein
MNGRHVICPPFLPIPQHPLSTTLNPADRSIDRHPSMIGQ